MMTQTKAPQTRTPAQQKIVSTLVTNFKIDGSRVLFLNKEDPLDPWIPASLLEKIARQIPGYQSSSVDYNQLIELTQQFVYTATVIDTQNRVFTRPGVAMIDEQHPETDEIFDPHKLAGGRALSAALKAAGFHPSEVDFGRELEAAQRRRNESEPVLAEAKRRTDQLGVIHKLAAEKGLVLKLEDGGLDITRYREKLQEKFGTNTAAALNETERLAVINWLDNYTDEHEIIPAAPGAEHLAV